MRPLLVCVLVRRQPGLAPQTGPGDRYEHISTPLSGCLLRGAQLHQSAFQLCHNALVTVSRLRADSQ